MLRTVEIWQLPDLTHAALLDPLGIIDVVSQEAGPTHEPVGCE